MSLLRQLSKLFGHHQASEEPATQAGRAGFPPPSRAQGAGFPPPSRTQGAGFPPPGAARLAEFPPPNAVPGAAAQDTADPLSGQATPPPPMTTIEPRDAILESEAPDPSSSLAQVDKSKPKWVRPTYRGRSLDEWVPDIRRLKRENQLADALEIATGCMESMIRAAEAGQHSPMEFCVAEVAMVLHKMENYTQEVTILESWLTRDLPGCDPDHTVDLRKRLAKAHELVAKANGRDSSIYHEEWKQLIALQKRMVQERASSGVRVEHWPPKSHRTSSRARAGSSRRRPSKFIPALDEFLAQPFVAADFETANRSSGVSACQIALVRVESGRVVDRFNTLLKPPSSFDDFEFTYLHGISARDTRTAPSWPDIVPAIRAFAGDATVYAHNAPFDSRVWRQLDEFFHTRSLPDHFFCSYLTARRMMPGLDNYRLPTVLERCAPHFVLDHHKADSDAEACALIVAALQSNPELYARLEAHR